MFIYIFEHKETLMKVFGTALKTLDSQPQQVGFQFKQDYTNKSKTGAICTCIMLAVIIITIYPIISDIIKGDYLNEVVKYENYPEASDVSVPLTKAFMFAVGIKELDLRYERIFKFKLTRTFNFAGTRNLTERISQQEVHLYPCTLKAWNDLGLSSHYNSYKIEQMLCPDPKQIFKLTKDKGYRLEVQKCSPQSANFPSNYTASLQSEYQKVNTPQAKAQLAAAYDYKGYDSVDFTTTYNNYTHLSYEHQLYHYLFSHNRLPSDDRHQYDIKLN